jgi:CPA1 family monovalent cation:H+ antiporter
MVWVFPGTYLPRFIRRRMGKHDSYPPVRQVLFVGWAGLRGADSLVIALALPLVTITGAPFPARNLIILLTFAIILVTLVLQGLTIAPVIRLLGLGTDNESQSEETKAQLSTATVGLRRLNELAKSRAAPSHIVNDLREKYQHRLHRLSQDYTDKDEAELDGQRAAAYREIRLEMIAAERDEIVRLRDEDVISDDVMRRIQRDLDTEEVLLSQRQSDADDDIN